MGEKSTGEVILRPGKLEKRASEIGDAVRLEILRVATSQKVGIIKIEIAVLNGGVGHCDLSNSRRI